MSLTEESFGEVNFGDNTTKIVINEQVVNEQIHQGEDKGENANINYVRSGCVLEKRKGEEELVVTLAGAEHGETLVSASVSTLLLNITLQN